MQDHDIEIIFFGDDPPIEYSNIHTWDMKNGCITLSRGNDTYIVPLRNVKQIHILIKPWDDDPAGIH